jgi:L,D-transpeptidase ErfK/SrfK
VVIPHGVNALLDSRDSGSSAMIRGLLVAAVGILGGCSAFTPTERHPAGPPQPTQPEVLAPLATHTFPFDPESTGVIGELQVTFAREEDTIADIARRFDLGFDEVLRANPGVDPWLPGDGTRIVLPTQFVLPDAPPEGLVVNVAALRVFYFPKAGKDGRRVVQTYPIGIGKVGWATPVGSTKIVSKRKDPWWTPPASVRREHAENGDPLPAKVPPGPDNPLGAFAMNLGWPSYLIHGTNKPAGVGLRASHGCIRMYPEDIAAVFDQIPVGTKVKVVNQPLLYRWHGDSLYVQSYPPHEETLDGKTEEEQQHAVFNDRIADRMWQRVKPHGGAIDWPVTRQVVTDMRGIAVPVSRQGLTVEGFLATARHVENAVPEGSNWDGGDDEAAGDAGAAEPVAGAVDRR